MTARNDRNELVVVGHRLLQILVRTREFFPQHDHQYVAIHAMVGIALTKHRFESLECQIRATNQK